MAIGKELKGILTSDFGGLKRYTKYLTTLQEKNKLKERIWFIDSSFQPINFDSNTDEEKQKYSDRIETLYREYTLRKYTPNSTTKSIPKTLAVRYIISFRDDDLISPENACELNKDFIKEFAGDNRLYDAIGHIDTNNNHIHGIFSNVNDKGEIFTNRSFTRMRMFEVLRSLEEKYGLKKLEVEFASKTYNESVIDHYEKERGIKTDRVKVAEDIKDLHNNLTTFKDLFYQLIELKLIPIPAYRKNKKEIYGWSFYDQQSGKIFKASQLNRKLSWNQISYLYDEERDYELFKKYNLKDTAIIRVDTEASQKKKTEIVERNKKEFKKILERDFIKKDNRYINKYNNRESFYVKGKNIVVKNTKSIHTIKASLQLANIKYNKVYVTGDKSFIRQSYIQNEFLKATNKNHTLVIRNYKPSKNDLLLIQRMIDDHNYKYNNKKNIEEINKIGYKLKY